MTKSPGPNACTSMPEPILIVLAFPSGAPPRAQVVGAGDLEIGGGALDEPGPLAQPFDRLRLIGRDPAGGVRASSASHRAPVAEHLRCQRAPQPGAVDGLLAPCARSRPARFSVSAAGVASRPPTGWPARSAAGGRDPARGRHGRAASWTSTQSRLRAVGQRREAIAHGVAALRAAGGRRYAPARRRSSAASTDRRRPAPPRCRRSADRSGKGASAHSITVRPQSGAYCFGRSAPKRRPLPAAGMTSQ